LLLVPAADAVARRFSHDIARMTLPAPTYDLVLLLDPQAEETVRTKLVGDTRTSISAQGELLRHDEWGERALTYPIERRATARYHLLQFHASDPELLSGLDRTLRLADEVLRFRIIKLAPGVPAAPDMSAAPAAARGEAAAGEAAPASETAPAEAAAAETPAPAEAAPVETPGQAEAPAPAETAEDAQAAAQAEADAEPTAAPALGESS
jgi:ribosomal protein S6